MYKGRILSVLFSQCKKKYIYIQKDLLVSEHSKNKMRQAIPHPL